MIGTPRSGKMSRGRRPPASAAPRATARTATMTVIGRRRAARTIHMDAGLRARQYRRSLRRRSVNSGSRGRRPERSGVLPADHEARAHAAAEALGDTPRARPDLEPRAVVRPVLRRRLLRTFARLRLLDRPLVSGLRTDVVEVAVLRDLLPVPEPERDGAREVLDGGRLLALERERAREVV